MKIERGNIKSIKNSFNIMQNSGTDPDFPYIRVGERVSKSHTLGLAIDAINQSSINLCLCRKRKMKLDFSETYRRQSRPFLNSQSIEYSPFEQ
jgi:hypothetical protein